MLSWFGTVVAFVVAPCVAVDFLRGVDIGNCSSVLQSPIVFRRGRQCCWATLTSSRSGWVKPWTAGPTDVNGSGRRREIQLTPASRKCGRKSAIPVSIPFIYSCPTPPRCPLRSIQVLSRDQHAHSRSYWGNAMPEAHGTSALGHDIFALRLPAFSHECSLSALNLGACFNCAHTEHHSKKDLRIDDNI